MNKLFQPLQNALESLIATYSNVSTIVPLTSQWDRNHFVALLHQASKMETLRSDFNLLTGEDFHATLNTLLALCEGKHSEILPSMVESFHEWINELLADRPQVWRAYSAAYIVDASDPTVFYAGPGAIKLLPCRFPAFVITAFNPFERILTPAENKERNHHLKTRLSVMTQQRTEVVGQSPCGRWHEESYLVGDVSLRAIMDLAQAFSQ